ncbi:MAG TPA: Calx-beta domain-containing protein, partial [Nevskiaceae bacterium]|nr:Calx-beta domain-containing protein [Nevskiaceae bacterium]
AWSDHGDLHRIMVRRFSGQENTDLSLTISDAPDPVPVGGALEYTLITTNHHAPEAPTSITPIDTAIGTSTRQRLAITLGSGQKYVSATGADWLCAASGNTAVNCASTRTQAPTTTRSLVLKLTAPTTFPVATPATTGISAKVVGEQPDSNETGDFVNNFDAESTRLCAKDTLALDAAHYYLLEGGSLTVRVKRTGAGCGSASVQFTTVAGTAVPRGDYVHVSRLLTWADGDTADKTVTIQSVNDTVPEGTQYFTVQLQKPNAFAVLGTAQATVEMPIDSD